MKKNYNNKLYYLRTFFKVSNAAFDCAMIMSAAFGGKSVVTPMHELHKLALIEIEKETPDLLIIDKYLYQMELLADENSQPKPKFNKGDA